MRAVLALSCALLAGVVAGPAAARTIVVDSNRDSLQRAIAEASDGDTLRLRGRFDLSGTPLVISGKRLHIVGSRAGGSELFTADRRNGILTYTDGGGGSIQNLSFRGGAYGIGGMRGRELPSSVELSNVSVDGGFRGIYGSFSGLSATSLEVSDTEWHGVSLTHVDNFMVFTDVIVHHTGGVGLWVMNTGPGDIFIAGEYAYNALEGIQVHGNVGSVTLLLTSAHDNGFYGASLWGVDATVGLSEFVDNHVPPEPGECQGAGLRALQGSDVLVGGVTFRDNCNGLIGSASTVEVNLSTFSSTGSPPSAESIGVFDNTQMDFDNSNVCGYNLGTPGEVLVDCIDWAQSGPLAPPDPVGPSSE